MNAVLTLQIILTKPTPGVLYGLQKGSGNNYETVQKQLATTNNLSFTCTITVKGNRSKDKRPKLSGEFVQGPANGKFIYIDIGTCAGQMDSIWSSRLKVPLMEISWQQIDAQTGNSVLQTTVPGTAKDGGPNCATVKPFTGWHLQAG